MSTAKDILGSFSIPLPPGEGQGEGAMPSAENPIQPPYVTRAGLPVCPDCLRTRCICAYVDPEGD